MAAGHTIPQDNHLDELPLKRVLLYAPAAPHPFKQKQPIYYDDDAATVVTSNIGHQQYIVVCSLPAADMAKELKGIIGTDQTLQFPVVSD